MKELKIEATIDNMNAVTDFVNEILEENDCPMKAQIQIDVAIDEIFSNIANYAYGDETGDAVVTVEVTEEPRSMVLTFKDGGVKFNPLEIDDPDITLSAEERDIGGLGILMVKKSMDKVEYGYINGQNVLTLTKNI